MSQELLRAHTCDDAMWIATTQVEGAHGGIIRDVRGMASTVRIGVFMQAYTDRQRQKQAKALDRRKLEPRIHDYVRDTVRSTLEKRSTV